MSQNTTPIQDATLAHYQAQAEAALRMKAMQAEVERWKSLAERLQAQADEMRSVRATTSAAQTEDWSVFICYLIDECEGCEVAEENLQRWLSDMLADPHYGALFRREKTADGKPVDHILPIVMAIEAAEEEHGSLRAAAKALGIDVGYLSRLKSGDKISPGDDVLSALGLERVTMYRAAPAAAPTPTNGVSHD